jgi:predicted nucleotidyltransferase
MEQSLDQNYRDMICLLNEESVEYLLVGGWAISFHAAFRYTEDLDLWVRPTPENATRLIRALDRFDAPRDGMTAEDFSFPRWGLHIGVPPGRIDIMTKLDPLGFDEAWQRRKQVTLGGLPIQVISRDDLIENKLAAGRDKDLRDVIALRKAAKHEQEESA